MTGLRMWAVDNDRCCRQIPEFDVWDRLTMLVLEDASRDTLFDYIAYHRRIHRADRRLKPSPLLHRCLDLVAEMGSCLRGLRASLLSSSKSCLDPQSADLVGAEA